MSQYPDFAFLGTSHLITLMIIFGLCLALWPLSKKAIHKDWVLSISRAFIIIICIDMLVKAVLYRSYGMPLIRLLPLQICDLNAVLCVFMLMLRSYRIYEVSYFWAIGGSTMAMLTPDLLYGYPHPGYIIFYLGHSLTVFSVLFATFAFGYQPQLRSVGVAVVTTVIYGLVMLVINFMFDTNFLYLIAKPAAPSLLDYMGPWPWYLLGLIAGCVVACFLCYMPFPILRRISRKLAS